MKASKPKKTSKSSVASAGNAQGATTGKKKRGKKNKTVASTTTQTPTGTPRPKSAKDKKNKLSKRFLITYKNSFRIIVIVINFVIIFSAQNAAQSIGKIKADRAAAINKRRGISTNSNATPKQIKAAVNSQLIKSGSGKKNTKLNAGSLRPNT